MKYLPLICLFLLVSCASKKESLSLADLKKGERAEIIAIEIEKEHLADSALIMSMLRRMGVQRGVKGISRGAKEAERGVNYGFDIEEGGYFGLYQPQAGMVKVKRLK